MAEKKPIKRYNLVLPGDLFDEIHAVAESRQITVIELLRKFIKLGLIAASLEGSPDSMFLIRQGGVDRQILLI